jgi:hypothetical protein
VSKGIKNNTEYVNFKLPAGLKNKLLSKHKGVGQLSITMRALVQMYIDGKLPPLEYVQKPGEQIIKG